MSPYISLENVLFEFHHLIHFIKMIFLCTLQLRIYVIKCYSFPLVTTILRIRIVFDQFLTKSTNIRLRFLFFDLIGLLCLQFQHHLLIFIRIFLVTTFLLSQARKNHLIIFINWTNAFPIQKPN